VSPSLSSTDPALIDSPAAWRRLGLSLLAVTLGSSTMYVASVALPFVQADFGVDRADASLPYTALMIGFGLGGVWMGRLADRHGLRVPLAIGSVGLTAGYALAALAPGIVSLTLVWGLLLGLLGSATAFAPLVADAAQWFERRRGTAVGVAASGIYVAGAVWPPIVQALIEAGGWRMACGVMAGVSALGMPLLAWGLRQRPPPAVQPAAAALAPGAAASAPSAPSAPVRPLGVVPSARPFGLPPAVAMSLLCVAGLACCIAMAMPQVHLVAYCTDLGLGAARGAEMLSLMLGLGILSRLASGVIADRIGGLRTLLLGSALQGLMLLLYIPFDSMVSLYVISALFGLFQGGIVPSYAIIVREHFATARLGLLTGTVLMATQVGMALGGWMSGWVFDWAGSYTAAFLNGSLWNLLNLIVVGALLWRVLPRRAKARTIAT
jgi:MFS family permease